MRLACGRVADPEFDGVGGEVDEGEMLSVSGPDGLAGACGSGKSDVDLFLIGHMDEIELRRAWSDAVAAGRVVLAVIAGFDADAC